MNTRQGSHRKWQRLTSLAVAVATTTSMVFALTGCGGEDAVTPIPTRTVAAPDAPTDFTVVKTPEALLSATLTWTAPTTGGAPRSFEIYRSTTDPTTSPLVVAANHLISIPVVAGKNTPYTFIDNAGLTPVNTWWAVSARNSGGETATAPVMYRPIGPPSGGGGGETAYGNNFSSALIFADDIGIGGAALDPAKSWTNDLTMIDVNTGLRPTSTEITTLAALPVPVTTLPYFDPLTAFTLNNVTYYKQATASTWQGQWEKGASANQHVTAKWGDNLISQRLTANSVVRIEMVLSKAVATPMTSYFMQSLYGSNENEVQGTDGTLYDNLTAFVFAANAHLRIQKMDGGGAGTEIYNNTHWQGDGPGNLGAEVNVAGNFTYGFVWRLSTVDPAIVQGTWRLTFSLDDNAPAPVGTPNNTFIDTAANGVLDTNRQVHIDIVVQ